MWPEGSVLFTQYSGHCGPSTSIGLSNHVCLSTCVDRFAPTITPTAISAVRNFCRATAITTKSAAGTATTSTMFQGALRSTVGSGCSKYSDALSRVSSIS